MRRLFPDFRRIEQDYYRRTRIFPIMHLTVIKRSTYEKNPSIAASLYRAFCESKERALANMRYLGTLRYMLPWLPADLDEIDQVFGGDCWPYGIEPNRPTLEALIRYMVEQGQITGSRQKTCLSGFSFARRDTRLISVPTAQLLPAGAS